MRRPNDDPVISLLRTVPGFATMPGRSIAALVPLVDQTDIPAGATLTAEGTASRQAFIVTEGSGTVSVDGLEIATVCAGDFVGEMGMLDRKPRSATVRADTPMHVLVLSTRAFEALMTHPRVATTVATQLSQRLRRVDSAVAPPRKRRSVSAA